MTLPDDLNIFAPGLTLLKTVTRDEQLFQNMVWSPDGRTLALASNDGAAFATVDLDTFVFSWHFVGYFAGVYDIAWSPKGDEVACVCVDGTILRHSLPAQKNVWVLSERTSFSKYLTWSPDGQLLALAGGERPDVSVWDAETGVLKVHLPTKSTARPVFFADSRRLICAYWPGNPAPLTVWDAINGEKVSEFRDVDLGDGNSLGQSGPAELLTLSSDERLLASGGYSVAIYDVQSGSPVKKLLDVRGKLESLAFSYNGAHLVGASADDNILRVWSAARDWKQVVQLPDFGGGWKGGAAFHPTESILATGAQGGHAVHFWEYNTSAWR